MTRRHIIQILKWVYLAAVVAGAAWYFTNNYAGVVSHLQKIKIENIFFSAISLVAGKLILADMTRLALKKIEENISYQEALTITSVSQLGKYIPGGIWHFVGKFGIYKARAVETKDGLRVMIWENAWLLSSAGVVGLLGFLITGSDTIFALVPFSSILFQSSHFLWIIPLLWLVTMALVELILFKTIIISDFLVTAIEQVVAWIFLGLSLFFVFPVGRELLLSIVGAFSLSWVGGYIAVFAPGGIGVRELLLSLILGTFFSSIELGAFAAAHRFIWIVVEIILGGISALLFGIPRFKPEPENKT